MHVPFKYKSPKLIISIGKYSFWYDTNKLYTEDCYPYDLVHHTIIYWCRVPNKPLTYFKTKHLRKSKEKVGYSSSILKCPVVSKQHITQDHMLVASKFIKYGSTTLELK